MREISHGIHQFQVPPFPLHDPVVAMTVYKTEVTCLVVSTGLTGWDQTIILHIVKTERVVAGSADMWLLGSCVAAPEFLKHTGAHARTHGRMHSLII